MTDTIIQLVLVGLAAAVFFGPKVWAWLKGLWPKPQPEADIGIADFVLAREVLRPILPEALDAALWKAIGEWKEPTP